MKIINTIILLTLSMWIMSFRFDHHSQMPGALKKPALLPAFVTFSVDRPGSNTQPVRLDFYYHDSLAYGHPVLITGSNTKLLLNSPALLIEASDKQTPFFIYPGEKINIRYAATDSLQMYIQGNAQRTNELNFFRQLVKKTSNVYYGWKIMPYHKRVKTVPDIYALERAINAVKANRLKLLNAFTKQQSVSGSFSKMAVNVIKSTALTDSLLLFYNNRQLLSQQQLYQKCLTEKAGTIKAIGFVPFQIYYRACTTLVSLSTGNIPDYMVNNSGDFIKRFNFIEANFNGPTRDFLLANTLYTARTNAVPVPPLYLKKFDTECADAGYKSLINKLNNDQQAIFASKTGSKLLLADAKTVKELPQVISSYKGKVTLLDFWASWCAPCRQEMPYLAALKKKYANKNIAFLQISKDSKIDSWLAANKEESLGMADNFLLLNADRSPFVKRYHINTLPRYLLINQDGKLLTDDAPRPSDPKLTQLIDKYISGGTALSKVTRK